MEIQFECVPCIVRQAFEALAMSVDDKELREKTMRLMLREIAASDWRGTPPMIAQFLHHIIKDATGIDDPYRRIKKEMNRMAADLIPTARKILEKSENRFEDALRLALAGNLLDSGAKTQVSHEDFPGRLKSLLAQPICGNPKSLLKEVEKASSILYLGDNAGEIYFDRLLIEMLPKSKITFAVRGRPIVNDALIEDAIEAGITDLVPVIDNGSDAPGTIIEDTSPVFRKVFDSVDLIIAKGQGNYETLSSCEKKIFFLLTVKCPVIASHVGEPVGSMVVKQRQPGA